MTQLVYHPAFDAYNAVLRIIRLLISAPTGLDAANLRILDFYLLFPESLIQARLTPQLRSLVRRLASKPRFPYDKLPTTRSLFERMQAPHDAARQTLISRAIATKTENRFYVDDAVLPARLRTVALERNTEEATLMEVLMLIGREFPISGPNSLKDRSGLLEYRYDVI